MRIIEVITIIVTSSRTRRSPARRIQGPSPIQPCCGAEHHRPLACASWIRARFVVVRPRSPKTRYGDRRTLRPPVRLRSPRPPVQHAPGISSAVWYLVQVPRRLRHQSATKKTGRKSAGRPRTPMNCASSPAAEVLDPACASYCTCAQYQGGRIVR